MVIRRASKSLSDKDSLVIDEDSLRNLLRMVEEGNQAEVDKKLRLHQISSNTKTFAQLLRSREIKSRRWFHTEYRIFVDKLEAVEVSLAVNIILQMIWRKTQIRARELEIITWLQPYESEINGDDKKKSEKLQDAIFKLFDGLGVKARFKADRVLVRRDELLKGLKSRRPKETPLTQRKMKELIDAREY